MKKFCLFTLIAITGSAFELSARQIQACARGKELKRGKCVPMSEERSVENFQSCHSDQEYQCDPIVENARGKAKCRCIALNSSKKKK